MKGWLKELDELLRGNKTRTELLAQGTAQLRIAPYVTLSILLGAFYGACMGLYSVLSRTPPVPEQLVASTVKVPLLFLLTLVVTFPSLYVFSALLRAKLNPLDALRIIIASIAVNLAVLASFGPITAFFTLTTTSYPFMKLLSFFFLAVSGAIGLGFLLRTLRRTEEARSAAPAGEGVKDAGATPSAGPEQAVRRAMPYEDRVRPVSRRVFRVWLVLYALVGVQMGWILRPFIGTPDLPFVWFRQRGGNVFLDVLGTFFEIFRS